VWGTLRVKCGESRKQLICYLAVLLRAIVLASPLTLGYAISDDRSLVRCAHTIIRPSVVGFRLRLSSPDFVFRSFLVLTCDLLVSHNHTIWLAVERYGGLRPLTSFALPSAFSSRMPLSPRLQPPPIHGSAKLDG